MGLGVGFGCGFGFGWGLGLGVGRGFFEVGVRARLRGREPLGRIEHESLLEEVGKLQYLLGIGMAGVW